MIYLHRVKQNSERRGRSLVDPLRTYVDATTAFHMSRYVKRIVI